MEDRQSINTIVLINNNFKIKCTSHFTETFSFKKGKRLKYLKYQSWVWGNKTVFKNSMATITQHWHLSMIHKTQNTEYTLKPICYDRAPNYVFKKI